MPPQEIERHFDGEKLVPLIRLPGRAQQLFAAPVKAGGQRRERNFLAVEGDVPVAGKVQADLDAAGMKTFAPVKFRVRFEIVPLEAHARAAHAAVQMPPAVANRMPRRTFGERRRHGEFRRIGGFRPLFDRFRHDHNVPFLAPRANILSLSGQNMRPSHHGMQPPPAGADLIQLE